MFRFQTVTQIFFTETCTHMDCFGSANNTWRYLLTYTGDRGRDGGLTAMSGWMGGGR